MFDIFGFILRLMQPVWNSLEPIFQWHYNCLLGNTISGTVWMFPVIETFHILAMAMMFGSMLVMNLRLLGLGMTRQSMTLLSSTLSPIANWGVGIMLLTGYCLFSSEAQKCFVNDGFKIKMLFLFLILIFYFTFYRSQIKQDDAQRSAMAGRFAAVGNFFLWFMVAVGGRAIGFV